MNGAMENNVTKEQSMGLEERTILFILLFLWGMLIYPLFDLLILVLTGSDISVSGGEVLAMIVAVFVIGSILRQYYRPGESGFLLYGLLFGFVVSMSLATAHTCGFPAFHELPPLVGP